MAPEISVRELKESESADALLLVWDVFMEYEAPDYSEEGIAEFYKSIHDEGYLSKLHMYGAFMENRLVGVIATRSEGAHIALFFVKGEYHGKGHREPTVQNGFTNVSCRQYDGKFIALCRPIIIISVSMIWIRNKP